MSKSIALSKGVPTDTTTIQLLETIAVVAIGLGVTGLFVVTKQASAFAIVGGLALLAAAFQARRRRCANNEHLFQTALYTIPKSRDKTLQKELPEDVAIALAPIYDMQLTRPKLADHLRLSLGETRSAVYVPVVLSYADRA
jgi:hypothetical protein